MEDSSESYEIEILFTYDETVYCFSYQHTYEQYFTHLYPHESDSER